MTKPTFFLESPESTLAFGRRLGESLPLGTTVALQGDLGAGKTWLTKGIAQGLGVSDVVTSPTFTLMADYAGTRGRLVHLDLYRLSAGHVSDLGLDEELGQPGAITVVEWPERLAEWPQEPLRILLTVQGKGRLLTIDTPNTPEWQSWKDQFCSA